VVSFLHANAERLAADGCPQGVLQLLRESAEKSEWHNLLLAVELVYLSDLFERNNIPVIAIKGTAQALLLYGTLKVRSSSDIDLLISPHCLEKAQRVLANAGYVLESNYPRHMLVRAAIQSVAAELMYRHKVTGILVELHWRFSFLRSIFNPKFNDVLEDAQVVKVGDREVKALSDMDMVVFLLFHGALHKWGCLMWVCDVAQVFRVTKPLDWPRLLDRASKLGVSRSVTFGLIVSHLLLGSPLPHEVGSISEKDPALPHLIKYVMRCLLTGDPPRRTFSDKLRFLSYQLRLERSLICKIDVLLDPAFRRLLVAAQDSPIIAHRHSSCGS
jgi:hypothetical protein